MMIFHRHLQRIQNFLGIFKEDLNWHFKDFMPCYFDLLPWIDNFMDVFAYNFTIRLTRPKYVEWLAFSKLLKNSFSVKRSDSPLMGMFYLIFTYIMTCIPSPIALNGREIVFYKDTLPLSVRWSSKNYVTAKGGGGRRFFQHSTMLLSIFYTPCLYPLYFIK